MQREDTTTPSRGPGRPREFNLDEALRRAVHLFSERGFHATSIPVLAEAMGVATGSLYKAFPDKRAVFIAALQHLLTQSHDELTQALAPARSGRDKLVAALNFYAQLSHGEAGRRGCLVVGTAAELATFDSEIAGFVTGAMKRREKLLADLLRHGQADGSVNASVDVKATARFLLCLLQGLRVVGKTSPTRAEMAAAVAVAMKVLD